MSSINSVKFLTANLLPYRDIEKKDQKKKLAILSIIAGAIGVFISMSISGYYLAQITSQEKRNNYLESENNKLKKELEQIKELKEQVSVVLARKDIVENLQSTRNDSVNLLNNLIITIPDSLYLKTLQQKEDTITVVGLTRSQAKIAAFFDNLEKSDLSQNVKLITSKATTVAVAESKKSNSRRKTNTKNTNINKKEEVIYEFSLNYDIERKKEKFVFIEEENSDNDKNNKEDNLTKKEQGINLKNKKDNKEKL